MIKEKFETKEEGIKYFKKIKESLKNNYDIYCVFNNQRKNLSQKNKDLQILGMEELCNYYIDYFSTLEKSLYKNPFSLWKTGSTEYVYL